MSGSKGLHLDVSDRKASRKSRGVKHDRSYLRSSVM